MTKVHAMQRKTRKNTMIVLSRCHHIDSSAEKNSTISNFEEAKQNGSRVIPFPIPERKAGRRRENMERSVRPKQYFFANKLNTNREKSIVTNENAEATKHPDLGSTDTH